MNAEIIQITPRLSDDDKREIAEMVLAGVRDMLNPPSEMMTRAELRDLFQVSPKTLTKTYLTAPGFPKPVGTGKSARWKRSEVLAYRAKTNGRPRKVG